MVVVNVPASVTGGSDYRAFFSVCDELGQHSQRVGDDQCEYRLRSDGDQQREPESGDGRVQHHLYADGVQPRSQQLHDGDIHRADSGEHDVFLGGGRDHGRRHVDLSEYGPVSCTNPSVPPGSTGTITAVYTVAAGTAAGTIITDTDTGAIGNARLESADNSATVNIAVASGAQADLSVTNSGSPNPVTAGNNITYTQSVTNNGPATANASGAY